MPGRSIWRRSAKSSIASGGRWRTYRNASVPCACTSRAAPHCNLYTGQRVSRDIDATFSHRIALPENLEVAYREADGAPQVLYFDRQYNDSFGLLHEDTYDDSVPLTLAGIDAAVLEVRLLSALDLAVSKLGRFSSQDREDIEALARHRLISSGMLRRRAEEALRAYVGDTVRVQGAIETAVRIVSDIESRRGQDRR